MNNSNPSSVWPQASWLGHWNAQWLATYRPEALTTPGSPALQVDADQASHAELCQATLFCGPDLEYDPQFLAFQRAWRGRPETQFEPAVQPDWSEVINLAESLLERSLDLRVVLGWVDACLNRNGWPDLSDCLSIIAFVLERFWPGVNPLDDEGDHYPRWNALESLGRSGPVFATIRNLVVCNDAAYGALRVKDFMLLAAGGTTTQGLDRLTLAARIAQQPDWLVFQRGEVEQVLSRCEYLSQIVQRSARSSDGASGDSGSDFLADLKSMLSSIVQVVPHSAPNLGQGGINFAPTQEEVATVISRPSHQQLMDPLAIPINDRAQAVAAINAVCAYLRLAEPSNPAQQLLQRALQVIDKDFLQVLNELLPDSLNEAARLLGVDPDRIRANS